MSFKVYISDISPLFDDKLFYGCYKNLPPYRKEKVDSKRLKTNKVQCLGAYILLNYALDTEGVDINTSEIAFNAYGKPYLKNSKVRFNVSHSGNYVMCAVCDKPVGCDIEVIRYDVSNIQIAKRFFCREEYEYLNNIDDNKEQTEAFFMLWTLKESYIKAIGKGLSAKLDDFCVDISKKSLCFKKNINNKEYCFRSYKIENAAASVCIEGGSAAENPTFIDIKSCLKQ